MSSLGTPIGDDDIARALPGITIVSYPRLASMDSLPFDSQGRLVLLYLTEDALSGHWTCLIKKGPTITFHDAYGLKPDSELRWLTKAKRQWLHEQEPFLTRLLKRSRSTVVYSPYHLQSNSHAVATCGKHCIARLLNKDMGIDEFAQWLKSQGRPDDVVEAIYEGLQK
jgi:hypothetical protein